MVSSNASTASTTSNGSISKEKSSKPIPIAVMRNAHEIIRGAMQEIQDYLDKDDFDSARKLWHEFNKFSDLHMKMEEGRKGSNLKGLFALVDEHGKNAAKEAGLRGHHMTLYELEEDVVDVFEKAPDMSRAKEIFPIFREENEKHLKEEEDVLMPAIQGMIRAGVSVKKYIGSDIIPLLLVVEGEMEFFIRFSNQVLERHDNVDGKPRVRVWNHALWSVATKEQWADWNVWIKDSLSEEKYAEVQKAIQDFSAEQRAKKEAKMAEKKAQEVPPLPTVNLSANSPTRFFKKLFAKSGVLDN